MTDEPKRAASRYKLTDKYEVVFENESAKFSSRGEAMSYASEALKRDKEVTVRPLAWKV